MRVPQKVTNTLVGKNWDNTPIEMNISNKQAAKFAAGVGAAAGAGYLYRQHKKGQPAKESKFQKQTKSAKAMRATGVHGLVAGAATVAAPYTKYGTFMPKKMMVAYGGASMAYGAGMLVAAHRKDKYGTVFNRSAKDYITRR